MILKLPVPFWLPYWFHTYSCWFIWGISSWTFCLLNKLSSLVSHKLHLTFLRFPGHLHLNYVSWFLFLICPWIEGNTQLSVYVYIYVPIYLPMYHSIYLSIFVSTYLVSYLLGCGDMHAITLVWRSYDNIKGCVLSSMWVKGINFMLSHTFNCMIGISKSGHPGKTPVYSSTVFFSQFSS